MRGDGIQKRERFAEPWLTPLLNALNQAEPLILNESTCALSRRNGDGHQPFHRKRLRQFRDGLRISLNMLDQPQVPV